MFLCYFRAINSKCYFIKNWNEEMIYFLVWMISVCEILFYKSFYEFVSYFTKLSLILNNKKFYLKRLLMNGK